MTIKIDLEKAYDRLSWDFITDTLKEVSLRSNSIDVVFHYITTSTIKMLQNGEALEEFHQTRGIRQGDLLSPYVFVLCMERLSHIISVAMQRKFWRPFKVGKNGPSISYLTFTDDLILFAEASMDHVEVISACLGLFY